MTLDTLWRATFLRRWHRNPELAHTADTLAGHQGRVALIIDHYWPNARKELIVHRAIYRATDALAVVHAHPRTAVALSFSRDEIVPRDSEGSFLLGAVPVVAVERPSGSPEVAEAVANALKTHPVVVVRSHGSFATGATLEQAFQRTSVLEEACEIVWKAEVWERATPTHSG